MCKTTCEALPLEDVLKNSLGHTCWIKLVSGAQGVLISHRWTRQVSAPFSDEWAQTLTDRCKKENRNISIRFIDRWYWCILTVALHPLDNVWDAEGRYPPELEDVLQRPFTFLQVHFIFISSKLERVNSIPRRLWPRLGTFTISPSFFCSCHLLSLLLPFLVVSKV